MKVLAGRPYYADQLGIDDLGAEIRGVMVGGCVHEPASWSVWDGTRSHAHHYPNNEFYGWICILSAKDVLTASGRPTPTLLHEVAHLLCPAQGHTRSWKRAVTRLGAGSEITRCHLKPL